MDLLKGEREERPRSRCEGLVQVPKEGFPSSYFQMAWVFSSCITWLVGLIWSLFLWVAFFLGVVRWLPVYQGQRSKWLSLGQTLILEVHLLCHLLQPLLTRMLDLKVRGYRAGSIIYFLKTALLYPFLIHLFAEPPLGRVHPEMKMLRSLPCKDDDGGGKASITGIWQRES